ncbi:MAG: hypothetical protein JST95_02055 [Bacteroidetes bacterium]|nr:hypothetical protein [Bacteroidota bacterium]
MLKLFPFLFICSILLGCKEKRKETTSIGNLVNKAAAGCSPSKISDKDWYESGKKAPVFDGLNGISFPISTSNKEAQAYFNQGMILAYGFNHAEAARSFFEVTRLDASCAMGYWGYAYVLGPNYNGGMEDDNYQRAFHAISTAKSYSKNCTQKELALIDALATRYASKPPKDRSGLDQAYANAMKKVYSLYPSDPDVGALYAESLMNLHPWDLYEKESKKPKSWTPTLLAILTDLMKKNPRHPGAHHFYIHAMEASSQPEKALKSASLLDSLVPGSGHLVHMPSHIYINTGHYHLGTLANLKAVKIDSQYSTTCHAQGVYPLAYYPHNFHFLTATATLEGNSKVAWMAAQKLRQHTKIELMDQPLWGTLQHYYSIPLYVAVQFGMWDTILVEPRPAKELPYPMAIWHYARGLSFLAKHNIPKAKNELGKLTLLSADSSLKEVSIWGINTTADLVQIAQKVLSAAIALNQNRAIESIRLLKEAVAIEDQLNYNEPPDWFFSVRNHLGAVLIKLKEFTEAERIYKEDLKTWKDNGWALVGLYQSLQLQQKLKEADSTKRKFDGAWEYADVNIVSSSFAFD